MLGKLDKKIILSIIIITLVLGVSGALLASHKSVQNPVDNSQAVPPSDSPKTCLPKPNDVNLPCKIMVYFNPEIYLNMEEGERWSTIQGMLGSQNISVNDFTILPSRTEVVVQVTTSFGKEDELGQKLKEQFPPSVDKYIRIPNMSSE